MRKEATLEQWKELYEIALKIKELEPWKHLWDMDVFTIKLPDVDQPCFCSILGHGGECYGINTFVGYDGLRDFISIAECEKDEMASEYVMSEQSNLSCYFGNRDEVPSKQKKIIKDLGCKFRGENQWIYFESYKKGYIPYILDEEETVLLTKCLQQFVQAFEEYLEQGIKVDFENGESLLRYYDNETKDWCNEIASLPFLQNNYTLTVLDDEFLKAKMKKRPKVNAVLEIDMVYMRAVIRDKEFDRPVSPKLLLMMDHNEDVVICQEMLTPKNDEAEEIMNMFIELVMQYGKPKQILIRNQYIGSVLQDTCKYCGISLIMKKQLEAVSTFMYEFSNFGQ